MLVDIVFHFEPEAKCSMPATDGPFVRDAILNLVKKKNLELSETLFDSSDETAVSPPYTISPIFGIPSEEDGRITLLPDEDYSIRITSIDKRVSNAFVSLKSEKELNIAENRFRVKEVSVNTTTFDSFHRKCWRKEPTDYIDMEFLTGTTFMVDGKNRPFPYPELVFGDLLRRWNEYSPSRIGDKTFDLLENNVYLLECKLQHRVFDFAQYRQVRFVVGEHKQMKFVKEDKLPGFVGTCKFMIKIEKPIWKKLVHLLAEFASFAGVGYRTNMGMGQVRKICEP